MEVNVLSSGDKAFSLQGSKMREVFGISRTEWRRITRLNRASFRAVHLLGLQCFAW